MTPIRRQYLKIKHSYPDAVVLFRLGDFYEAFDDDARLAARELEITLTSRSMGRDVKVPMAGVPAHALESYLARLIKKGFKVAICEQLSDPATTKGLLERDVVRVVTPGTVLESALLDQKANNYLAAVVSEEMRLGLAYVDITTGEFAATQLEAERLGPELQRIAPAEILATRSDDRPEWSAHYTTTLLAASSFDLEGARQALLSHYGIISLDSLGCADLPLAVRAAGAIIDYLQETQKGARPQLALLTVYSTASFMTLDVQTRRNLELFQAGRRESTELSLLATLDTTRTPMGGRLLHRWLGQPLLDLSELDRRLDAVAYFYENALRRSNTRNTLGQIPDLERILSRIKGGAVAPRELVALKRGLEAVPPLQEQLDDIPGGVHSWLRQRLVAVPDVVAFIERAIVPEPVGEVGEGNVIRPGFSPELDELKQASSDGRQFIASLEKKERERTGIKNLRVGYNQVFGYYIEISKGSLPQAPADYVRRQSLANGERFIIPQLKEYESLVLNAQDRIQEMERSLYRRVCGQIGESGEAIARLAGAIGELDVFASLAEVAVRNGYVRPKLNLERTISIKNGRHPVVEGVLPRGSFVPNDVYLSNDDARIIVLTGPNMAGKSTFIRQSAIIVLMAQIGSFVPASEATIGLVDRIFTRVGLQDDLTTGQSTFMVEMVETAAILNQATAGSLVILDEIGRGTSTYDGLSIARSVIEYLHNHPRLGCKTLFATHYHELTELADTLPGVRNFSVGVTEEDGKVIFLHRIVPGGADKSYGIHVGQLAGLPRAVVSRAWEVLGEMQDNHGTVNASDQRRPRRSPATQMGLFNQPHPVLEEVVSLDISNLTPLEAINKLYELQKKAKG